MVIETMLAAIYVLLQPLLPPLLLPPMKTTKTQRKPLVSYPQLLRHFQRPPSLHGVAVTHEQPAIRSDSTQSSGSNNSSRAPNQ